MSSESQSESLNPVSKDNRRASLLKSTIICALGGMMKIHTLSFGSINIDGQDYVKDIVIHKGNIEKRKKKNQKDINLILHLTC
jgi:hypothetical protein